MNEPLAALDQVQSTAIDLGLKFGPKLFVALIVLAIGHFVGRWIGKLTEGLLTRLELDVTIRILLVRIARLLVFALFVVMALQNLGVELLPLIAGLGVAGAGAALAMQGVLGNLAAGLTIIFTRPFKVGEYISIAGEEGDVEAITLFNTSLNHPDRSRVVIPNRKIVGEILHNYGNLRQMEIAVGVAYDTDIDLALTAIQEVLLTNPRVLRDPAPLIQVITLADSSVTIGVKPWVQVADFYEAIGEINKSILEALRGRGIVIPFPQREVRLLGNAAQ